MTTVLDPSTATDLDAGPAPLDDTTDTTDTGDRRRSRQVRAARVLLVLLTLSFVGSGLVQAWRDAPTIDEVIDLSAGLSYWGHHDLRMEPEHPILPKLLSALPAMAAKPAIPKGPSWRAGDWLAYTKDVITANQQNGRLHETVFLSRLAPLLEAAACGWLIYLLGRRLFGETAGIGAAGLWFTTPLVLGLGHIQSLDISFTLATLAVALALLRHREHPTTGHAVTVGIALALTLLCRHTGIVLVPIVVVVAAWPQRTDRRAAARTIGLIALVAYLGLWVGYRGFDLTSPTGPARARETNIIASAKSESGLARLVLAVPAPREWQTGFAYLSLPSGAHPAWLMGQAWDGSRWWYFPVAIGVKIPTGALLVLLLGPLGWLAPSRRRRRNGLLVVVLPAAAIAGGLVFQGLDVGVRLAIPCLALGFVAAAPAIAAASRRRVGQAALAVLAVAQLAAFGSAGFHSLAWTPAPFQPGYRYSSDIDWGQDRTSVDHWAEGRHAWVSLFNPIGLPDPPGSRSLVGVNPTRVTGWVAVGVTSLTVINRDDLAWLRAYCPVGTIDGTVLIYHFAHPPTSAPGTDRPPAVCPAGSANSVRSKA